MVRSPSKGRNDHDKSILTAQSDHDIDNKHRSTVENEIVTACSDVGGSEAAATDENDPETQTMTEEPAAKSANIIKSPLKSPGERNLRSLYEFEHKFDDGYDLDGRIGPFWYGIKDEGEQYFDESDLMVR